MKKILLILILLGVAYLGFFLQPKLGGPLTEEEMETLLLQRIATSQDSYKQTYGKYWQGLRDKSAKPHYQNESMDELVDFTNLPMDVMVHQYKTPEGGHGYQVIIEKNTTTERIVKSFGYGPEAQTRTYETIIPFGTASST